MPENINKKSVELLKILENTKFDNYAKVLIDKSISQLFPYSGSKFDPHEALIQSKKSIENLNRRLSNLEKINKSLDIFENEINSLNWEELQRIGLENQSNEEEN